MYQVYPKSIVCVPEGDRDEMLIAEYTKVEFATWAKENDPNDFAIVDLERKRIPTVTLVASRDYIAAYTGPVERSLPIVLLHNRKGYPKLERMINWYQRKNYLVTVA